MGIPEEIIQLITTLWGNAPGESYAGLICAVQISLVSLSRLLLSHSSSVCHALALIHLCMHSQIYEDESARARSFS